MLNNLQYLAEVGVIRIRNLAEFGLYAADAQSVCLKEVVQYAHSFESQAKDTYLPQETAHTTPSAVLSSENIAKYLLTVVCSFASSKQEQLKGGRGVNGLGR